MILLASLENSSKTLEFAERPTFQARNENNQITKIHLIKKPLNEEL